VRLSRLEFVSIRWRLALVTAGVTFAVLLLFAIVIGTFTINRIRSDFDDELRSTGADLAERLRIERDPFGEPRIPARDVAGAVVRAAASGNAAARVVNLRGGVVPPSPVLPDLGAPTTEVRDAGPYRVVSTPLFDGFMPLAWLQFGREDRDLNATVARVKVFLGLGVVGGTVLALLAGLGLARRAMAPVWRLTGAAREITRTRDPSLRLPHPPTDDEVADLSRTLEAMLAALDESRGETEAALARQREFVADASHELRTPLTSVLANLELLEASLRGEDRELADSALRSSRRM
jgi:two-component system, OmpR family, sensor kinase